MVLRVAPRTLRDVALINAMAAAQFRRSTTGASRAATEALPVSAGRANTVIHAITLGKLLRSWAKPAAARASLYTAA